MGITLIFTTVIIAILFTIVYLHNVGVPEKFHSHIIKKLEEKNIFVQFSSLKFQINKGVVTENLKVFKTAQRTSLLVNIEKFSADFDKSKLIRGIIEIDSADITNGLVKLSLTENLEHNAQFNLQKISGEFSLSPSLVIESRKGITLFFEGIEFLIGGNIKLSDMTSEKPSLAEQQQLKKIVDNILSTTQKLGYPKASPPLISVEVNGDLSKIEELYVKLNTNCPTLSYKQAKATDIEVEAILHKQLLNLNTCKFTDNKGTFSLQADYSLVVKEGTFNVKSGIDFKTLIKEFYSPDFAKEVYFDGATDIEAAGSIKFRPDDNNESKPQIKILGKAKLSDVRYLMADFDYLGSNFSWSNNSLYLSNLQAFSEDSEFNGRLLMTDEEIKFSSNSSLSPLILKPFLKGKGFERALDKVQLSDSSIFNISAEGTVNRKDITDWKANGDIYIANINYKDTMIEDAGVEFKLGPELSTYENIFLNIDHSNYPKQQKYKLSEKGNILADSVIIVRDPNTGAISTRISNITGEAWATPLVKMFAEKQVKLFNSFNLQSPIKINKTDLYFFVDKPNYIITGSVDLDTVNLSGIQAKQNSFDLEITRGKTKIKNIKTNLDYSSYHKEKNQAVPTDGSLEIRQVLIDLDSDKDQLITIQGIKGYIWPSPATSLFAASSAATVEKIDFTAPVKSNNTNLIFIQGKDSWYNILQVDCSTLEYGNVRLNDVTSKITTNENSTFFDDTTLSFDHFSYKKYQDYGGDAEGKTRIKSITLNDDQAVVTGLSGTLWPGQVSSMFSVKAGQAIQSANLTSPLKIKDSSLSVSLKGDTFVKAIVELGPFTYNNAPVNSLNSSIFVDDNHLNFTNLKANLDYSNYTVRKEFQGVSSSSLTAKKITLGLKNDLVTIDNLSGYFWPGAAIALFDKDIAKEIDTFRFNAPPYSDTSGQVDISKNGGKTSLVTQFKAKDFKYNFLDKDVQGTSISTTIKTTSQKVALDSVKIEAFNTQSFKSPNSIFHPISGDFTYVFDDVNPSYYGNIAINNLSIAALAKTYEIEDIDKGYLSTLLQFSGDLSGVKTLNTNKENSFTIEHASLAKIPLLGPFSKLTSAISKNKNAGYSEISEAKGNYKINNGILQISDLVAKSSTLTLAGKGKYNLDSERIDMKFEVTGFKKVIRILDLIKPIAKKFPIIKGTMKYKVYGQLEDIKILPDI